MLPPDVVLMISHVRHRPVEHWAFFLKESDRGCVISDEVLLQFFIGHGVYDAVVVLPNMHGHLIDIASWSVEDNPANCCRSRTNNAVEKLQVDRALRLVVVLEIGRGVGVWAKASQRSIEVMQDALEGFLVLYAFCHSCVIKI